MSSIPILFMSDSPYLPTGLARITKDLASLCSQLPQFRVGVFGRGGIGSSKMPFTTYSFPDSEQWGENWIQNTWEDFAGSSKGIIMSVMDLSRLDWFARPRMGGQLQSFLESGRFKKWAYIPIDHFGVGERLTSMSADTLLGFDRILAYTIFGKGVIGNTLEKEVDWIPHGINGDVFTPKEKTPGRMTLGVKPDETLIGCVMSNQSRKDWGTAFATAAAMARPGLKFWFHTDTLLRYWSMLALARDFRLENYLTITTANFTSAELSYLYSACDLTFLPSLGEGFGYPIVESLACGVPVVHGNYGGGQELVPDRNWLVERTADRLDTQWNCVRPVWSPVKWAETMEYMLREHCGEASVDVCVNSVTHLLWKHLWPSCWKKWFLEGLDKE